MRRLRELAAGGATLLVVLLAPLAAAYGLVQTTRPTLSSPMLPWITGRALGLAAYGALWATVLFGTVVRAPGRLAWPHPESRLRAHAALGVSTLALVTAHLWVLAADRYAGVGWRGALLPGAARYRPLGVALGVLSCYAIALIVVTAKRAGGQVGRHWLGLHRLALATYALVTCHAVLAGSDTAALRAWYVATGAAVALAAAWKAGWLGGRQPAPHRPDPMPPSR
ncbi:MAG: hypothetical protein M0004_03890 [Actinomycetota bacterium]|nr:hypothetical protein [Actinomycetota bacterium]